MSERSADFPVRSNVEQKESNVFSRAYGALHDAADWKVRAPRRAFSGSREVRAAWRNCLGTGRCSKANPLPLAPIAL